MSSKKWINLILTFIFIFLTFHIILYMLVNPYKILNNSITEKKFVSDGYINTIRLYDKLNYSKYSLVFGTSRSHQLQSDNSNIPLLNFSGSLYGNSINVLEFLKQLNNNQLNNISNIYYLVDDHTLNGYENKDKYSKYKYQNYTDSIFFYKIKDVITINFTKIENTYIDLYNNLFKKFSFYISDNGSMIRVNKNESVDVPNNHEKEPTRHLYTDDGINALIEIDKFCKINNINIIYFTPTHFHLNNKLIDIDIIKEKWTKILNGGIDGFYALWSIPDISDYIENGKYVAFKDTSSHLNEYYNHKVFIENIINKNDIFYINNKIKFENYINSNRNNYKSKIP